MLLLRERVTHNLTTAINHLAHEAKIEPLEFEVQLDVPPKAKFGDLTTNIAMVLFAASRGFGSARELAQAIIDQTKMDESFERLEAVGPGYINVFLKPQAISTQLADVTKDANYGKGSPTRKKINVEFISANPTGPLTLANGRGGYNGDVLANVLAFRGHAVNREYLINDAGNQVQALLQGEYPISQRVQEFIAEAKPSDEVQAATEYVVDGLIKPAVQRMGIEFDTWFSERAELHQSGKVDAMLELLKGKELIYEQDGATWLKAKEFGDQRDRVLIKSDGAKTYLLVDLAYHWNKFTERGYDVAINLWGADHAGQVPSLRAGLKALGIDQERINIIVFQLVRLIKDGQEFKMSKREGHVVTIDELLDLLSGEIGEQQAKDVTRYFFLSREHNTHMDFDLDLAQEQSEKNPVFYIQYAYARTVGIFKQQPTQTTNDPVDYNLLDSPEEVALVKQLTSFGEMVREVSDPPYPVHKLPYYTYELATLFHRFYRQKKVMGDDPAVSAARLELVEATRQVIGRALGLMGLSIPTEGMYREGQKPRE